MSDIENDPLFRSFQEPVEPTLYGQSARELAAREEAARVPKSRTTYILLGLFFGLLGFHNFYAGRGVAGFLQLIGTPLLGFLFFPLVGLVFLWVILEICLVERDGAGRRFG